MPLFVFSLYTYIYIHIYKSIYCIYTDIIKIEYLLPQSHILVIGNRLINFYKVLKISEVKIDLLSLYSVCKFVCMFAWMRAPYRLHLKSQNLDIWHVGSQDTSAKTVFFIFSNFWFLRKLCPFFDFHYICIYRLHPKSQNLNFLQVKSWDYSA